MIAMNKAVGLGKYCKVWLKGDALSYKIAYNRTDNSIVWYLKFAWEYTYYVENMTECSQPNEGCVLVMQHTEFVVHIQI